MAPKKLHALRLLLEHPEGLYGSELVHISEGKLNRGTVYTLLERLIEDRLVREEEVAPTTSFLLARTRHHITAKGKAAYADFLKEHSLSMAPFRQHVSV